ncbi:hypothetical protein [Lentzea albida]|uniref:hypothetical protein n=1 Tax=Lentzea albida TaxID=65499 RepID=UPI00116057A4|nr:hypothetical protein [Lentzea albida]
MVYQESTREQERREWVTRQEAFKDAGEAYEAALAAAKSDSEKKDLQHAFSEYRTAHRQEDIRRGKRLPGTHVAMHQIMWARWLEVAVEHELLAREAFPELLAKAKSDAILREFRASLVAVTSSAYTVEAFFGDIKYLLPAPTTKPNKRHLMLSSAFKLAFGMSDSEHSRLQHDLAWLFELRDQAAHPYTESEPAQEHPAGFYTGAECCKFNAVTSGRAVDIALAVLKYADPPTSPANRWIERWTQERAAYHRQVVDALREKRLDKPLVLSS